MLVPAIAGCGRDAYRVVRPPGVRTPSTMRSDAAFEAANEAAAPLTAAGGAILAVCGVLAAALPKRLAGASSWAEWESFSYCASSAR
jgi:hypothetical protein